MRKVWFSQVSSKFCNFRAPRRIRNLGLNSSGVMSIETIALIRDVICFGAKVPLWAPGIQIWYIYIYLNNDRHFCELDELFLHMLSLPKHTHKCNISMKFQSVADFGMAPWLRTHYLVHLDWRSFQKARPACASPSNQPLDYFCKEWRN